jgi:protein SPA2
VILFPKVPFLPVREEFHPKRNQARQKLATLPASRFEDLSSDVYFELARRYPEFKEDVRYLDYL